ncbi:MAG: glycosyltransferase family 4 protein [Candidatus Aminicenantes bacterium]|nr:glycosyltransferase family 4 protein [Candidatus Aminicenantes bacterium]
MQKNIIYVYNDAGYLLRLRGNLLRKMKDDGWRVLAAAPPGPAAAVLEDRGFGFRRLPFPRRGMNPLSDMLLLLRLYRLYRRERPAIVHHFTIKPVVYGTLAARLAGVPGIVNGIPGLGYAFLRGGLLRFTAEILYRLALPRRGEVVFQNPEDRDHFLSRGMAAAGRTHVICGSGVDTREFAPSPGPSNGRPRRKESRSPDGATFAFIGRLLWDKGLSEFASAAEAVKKSLPETRFLLAGGPDPGNPASVPVSWMKRRCAEIPMDWIGRVEDVRPVLAAASVVVLPSYREGAPRSLLEAAAMGKPLIASDVPGCREAVRHGENGLLVPEKNAAALAEAMLKLAGDPKLRRRMGRAGRERALRLFDERIVVRRTLEVYGRTGCL